jgi:hypothetical protein
MTAWGVSLPQPPYLRPRAHTPPFLGGAVGIVSGIGGISTWGRDLGGGAGRRGGAGRSRRAAGAVGVDAATGADAAAGLDAGEDALGVGRRDGPISSSASRAGACTTWVSVVPSGRGSDDWDGVGGVPGGGGRCVVTQPVRAETATVTRSVAVVVGRCTRATLLCPCRFGEGRGGGCPTRVTPGPTCDAGLPRTGGRRASVVGPHPAHRPRRRRPLGAPRLPSAPRPAASSPPCPAASSALCPAAPTDRCHAGPEAFVARRPPPPRGPGALWAGAPRAPSRQCPVDPSIRSRRRSAWPLWRAYSSIMWV